MEHLRSAEEDILHASLNPSKDPVRLRYEDHPHFAKEETEAEAWSIKHIQPCALASGRTKLHSLVFLTPTSSNNLYAILPSWNFTSSEKNSIHYQNQLPNLFFFFCSVLFVVVIVLEKELTALKLFQRTAWSPDDFAGTDNMQCSLCK